VLLALAGLACGGSDSPPPPDPRPSASASATATPEPRPALCEPLRARVVGHVDPAAGGELSGLVLSRSGLLWTHNDSGGAPQVFGLSRTGQLRATVTLAGATNVDWEDIAIRGRTLYVADIGDNLAARADIAIYRFAEPAPGTSTVPADRIVLRYPHGPRDAEALLIDPRSGTVVIVTKDIGGRSDVYVAGRNGLRRAARLQLGIGQAITAGDVSGDGRTIVLRSYDRAFVWAKRRTESIATALRRAPCAADADLIEEGQGEALALTRNGRAFYTVPEGVGAPLRRYAR
jgi:hypothetical protein